MKKKWFGLEGNSSLKHSAQITRWMDYDLILVNYSIPVICCNNIYLSSKEAGLSSQGS